MQSNGEAAVAMTGADFHKSLLEAGARLQDAEIPWVLNHLQWICWKLAALELQHPQLKGQLLCAEMILDELKIRYGC